MPCGRLPMGVKRKEFFASYYGIDMRAKALEFHEKWLAETGRKDAV